MESTSTDNTNTSSFSKPHMPKKVLLKDSKNRDDIELRYKLKKLPQNDKSNKNRFK